MGITGLVLHAGTHREQSAQDRLAQSSKKIIQNEMLSFWPQKSVSQADLTIDGSYTSEML